MPTIYDIAKKTGFSITTVSKVLNNYTDVSEKTKKTILKAVEEMGYFPSSYAQTLTTKKSWTLGVIFVESLGVGIKHPFFSAVIESFKQQVEKVGYDLLFVSNHLGDQKKSYLNHFQQRGVDGVIVVCTTKNHAEVEKIMESSLPTVVIDESSTKTNVIYSDNLQGSELAVDYLHGLGHRKIAHIYGHQDTFAGAERLRGFREVVKKRDLLIPSSYIVDGGFFSIDGGKKAMETLLALPEPPTAVYVAGDLMALGAIHAVKEQDLTVPNDISIIGFDDIEIVKHTEPTLTTIRQNTDLLGKEAADLLLNQIKNNEKEFQEIVVPVEIVERRSCGPMK